MRKVVDDPRLIFKCCKLYYEEQIGQQQIADRLGISRVSVSRMLAAGKEMGIVLIQVISPDNLAYSQLEQKLERLFGLKEAVVVENSPLNTKYDHATSLGTKTIKLLETYLHDGDIVGVSMGQTLYTVCHSPCVDTEAIACTFVPVIGGVSSGGNHSVNVHANQIAMGFAKLFKSEYFEFFAPAMFSNKAIMDGFMRERMMKRILQYYKDMTTVIVGIGIPDRYRSTMITAGYITEQEMDELVVNQVAGDISLQFYDRSGNTQPYQSFNERVTGMPLQQLSQVKNRIGIGSGMEKAEAVYGALQGGYINILVTDEECARELIRIHEQGMEGTEESV